MSDEAATVAMAENEPVTVYSNARGVIAENYYELQGLAVLDGIRDRYPLPRASASSMARALFQSVEIALINLNDLLGRTVRDLQAKNLDEAVTKLFWARGFHRMLNTLGLLPTRLNAALGGTGIRGTIRLAESPAFQAHLALLRELDSAVRESIESGVLDADGALAYRALESADYNILHLLRICNHESMVWEANLAEVHVDALVPSYAEFVVTDGVYACVYDRVLQGDTYFTQFRGLHQIPETIGEEANDQTEQAILDIRSGALASALERLRMVVDLLDTMVAALPPMVDNLATSDYHDIRENLGLTSGSHSVCLHYHMFNDLYQQLAAEIAGLLATRASGEQTIADRLAGAGHRRFDEPKLWFAHQIVQEGLKLRALIFHWRNSHLHLPRNNLGGDMTKSLTGAPEAIRAVRHMMTSARNKDPMKSLARTHGLEIENRGSGPLVRYMEAEDSLDTLLLEKTGAATQVRFQDVQMREGFFATRCPFKAPPRRIAGETSFAAE